MFNIDLDANINMTCYKGEFKATFPQMVERFGKGIEGDYKISMEWVFTDDAGNVFTVYDWKSTRLYADNYPAPEQLWKSDESYNFHVGGHGRADDFIGWITEQLSLEDQQETFVIEWTEKHRTRVRALSGESALESFTESENPEEDHGYPMMTFCEVVNVNLINETHKVKEGFIAE